MKNTISKIILCCLTFFISGCGLQLPSKINTEIIPPSDYIVANERIFNAPYDKVWKATINSVSQSFFTLDNIEKDSGILSLSFTTENPSQFIDCGKIICTGNLGLHEYNQSYKGTDTPVDRMILFQNEPRRAERILTLSGKTNIVITSISSDKTQIKINTNYQINMNYLINMPFSPYKLSETITLTNSSTGKFTSSPEEAICHSNYQLETFILDNIKMLL